MYCSDPHDRKDLQQEMLIQLWKSYPSFKGTAQFSTWIYRVCLNVAIQDFRKSSKQRAFFTKEEPLLDLSEPTVDSDYESQSKQLHQAINQLSKIEKAIIMLYMEAVPNPEIGEIIGISTNYVGVRINRIKAKLVKSINE
jgi:RNA polymerase sigma-70 factor (ECF subfamily)